MIAVLNLGIGLGNTLADGIVERCAATWAVGFPVQILSLCSGQVVVMPGGVAAVEGKQGNIRKAALSFKASHKEWNSSTFPISRNLRAWE